MLKKTKRCKTCKKSKPLIDFSTRYETKKPSRRHQCKTCRSIQRRRRYLENPISERYLSWRAQGIDVEEATRRRAEHNGLCELCGIDRPRGMGDWHIDHKAGSSKVRGILCFPCNIVLGKVERIGIEKISEYLKRC